jgi:hypothetical protein
LTTVFKSGKANSTLAQSKGTSFLLVTEPDNGTADCSLNIDFVKLMTGGDEIMPGTYIKNQEHLNHFLVYYYNVIKNQN